MIPELKRQIQLDTLHAFILIRTRLSRFKRGRTVFICIDALICNNFVVFLGSGHIIKVNKNEKKTLKME